MLDPPNGSNPTKVVKPQPSRIHLSSANTPHLPILQSQFFSQSYESILPNSFTHILLCTRGYSPWKPEAVLSTPTRWKKLWGMDPAIFKERDEETEQFQKRNCFAVSVTSSLRKGIPTSHTPKSLRRKEDSSQFPSRRVAVSLRCRAISHNWRRSGILTRCPFTVRNFKTSFKIHFWEHLPPV